MSVTSIQMPWPAGHAKPTPDGIVAPTQGAKPKPSVRASLGESVAAPPNGIQTVTATKMPDLHFPDPLPDLPKIDLPPPNTGYPAALGILAGSGPRKLG